MVRALLSAPGSVVLTSLLRWPSQIRPGRASVTAARPSTSWRNTRRLTGPSPVSTFVWGEGEPLRLQPTHALLTPAVSVPFFKHWHRHRPAGAASSRRRIQQASSDSGVWWRVFPSPVLSPVRLGLTRFPPFHGSRSPHTHARAVDFRQDFYLPSVAGGGLDV